MNVTPRELKQHLSCAPVSALAQTLSPNGGGEAFSCLRCQHNLRRAVMKGGDTFGSPTFRRYTDSIGRPAAAFLDAMRWKCAECGAGGLRDDLERQIIRDPDLTVRFLAAITEVSRAA